jgi:hypothetical protein
MAKTSSPEAVPMLELGLIFETGESCFWGLWVNVHPPKMVSGTCEALKLRFKGLFDSYILHRML